MITNFLRNNDHFLSSPDVNGLFAWSLLTISGKLRFTLKIAADVLRDKNLQSLSNGLQTLTHNVLEVTLSFGTHRRFSPSTKVNESERSTLELHCATDREETPWVSFVKVSPRTYKM